MCEMRLAWLAHKTSHQGGTTAKVVGELVWTHKEVAGAGSKPYPQCRVPSPDPSPDQYASCRQNPLLLPTPPPSFSLDGQPQHD